MRPRSYEVVQKSQGQPEGMNTGVHPCATCQFESGETAGASTLAELRHPESSSLIGYRSLDMTLSDALLVSFSRHRFRGYQLP